MTNTSHTPGPWTIEFFKDNLTWWVRPTVNGKINYSSPVIADVHDDNLANARLIAAAPELLASAKRAETQLRHCMKTLGIPVHSPIGLQLDEICRYLRSAAMDAEGSSLPA